MLLIVLDFAAAVAMVSLMKAITANFGFGTEQERWALIRRILYAIVALSLFSLGSYRLGHLDDVPELSEDIPHMILVAYVLFFPALRASGMISQDKWI